MSGFSFLTPLGLWGLGALAAVGVIYLFYQRFRERTVTGLFLWDAPAVATRGGRRLTPPHVTRSFLLDVLAVILVALALAAPAWVNRSGYTLVVVLDDSLSMRANDVHQRVRREALSLLEKHDGAALLFAAGSTPRILADQNLATSAHQEQLGAWDPFSPRDTVVEALRLCRELISGRAVVHVFTDHPVAYTPPIGMEVRIHRYAARGANVALVDAERFVSAKTGEDKLFLSVANYSAHAASPQLQVLAGETRLYNESLSLAAGKKEQVTLMLPAGTGTVRVRLEGAGDALAADSAAELLPPPLTKVYAKVSVNNEKTAALCTRALRAAGAVLTNATSDLLITDATADKGALYTLRLIAAKEGADPLIGPWVVDFADPLCQDIQLGGVYWPCDPTWRPAGAGVPLIGCGATPLYVELEASVFALNLNPSASNIVRTPAWPVLLANLVRHTREALPGVRQANYTPGQVLRFNAFADATKNPIRLDGQGKALPLERFRGVFALPEQPGTYALCTKEAPVADVRVNAIAPRESDLRLLSAADTEEALRAEGDAEAALRIVSLAWLFLLLAMLVTGMNWWLDRREHAL